LMTMLNLRALRCRGCGSDWQGKRCVNCGHDAFVDVQRYYPRHGAPLMR